MKMPNFLPVVTHVEKVETFAVRPQFASGLRPQGCNVFDWAKCASVLAACASLSGPALVACVAGAAPGCLKCL